MTRQERLMELGQVLSAAVDAAEMACVRAEDGQSHSASRYGEDAAHGGGRALDHIAALEQAAIDVYLAEVPLPAGWTEEVEIHNQFDNQPTGYRYWWVSDPDFSELQDVPYERVYASQKGVRVWATPAYWPAIPLPVLLRAAVQCHRLREAHDGD